jgi:hypothetical protein
MGIGDMEVKSGKELKGNWRRVRTVQISERERVERGKETWRSIQ